MGRWHYRRLDDWLSIVLLGLPFFFGGTALLAYSLGMNPSAKPFSEENIPFCILYTLLILVFIDMGTAVITAGLLNRFYRGKANAISGEDDAGANGVVGLLGQEVKKGLDLYLFLNKWFIRIFAGILCLFFLLAAAGSWQNAIAGLTSGRAVFDPLFLVFTGMAAISLIAVVFLVKRRYAPP